MTVEDRLALDKVQKSIEFVGGHYQVAIPWRKDKLSIPNNYKMALERLKKLETRLQKNSDVAGAYDDTIRKHIQKGYVRRVEPIVILLKCICRYCCLQQIDLATDFYGKI